MPLSLLRVFLLAAVFMRAIAAESVWPHETPEHEGMSRAALDEWRTRLARQNTTALLVMRHDKIVYEWYAAGNSPATKQGTASMTKAIVGGSSLMVALQDKRIKVDDLAAKYIPAWRTDPQKKLITIRQLATHTSGIEDAEQGDIDHMQLPGWKGEFWKRTPDPFSIAIHQAPVIFTPGKGFEYSNPGMAALAYAVTASMQGGAQQDIRAVLKSRILEPLGVPDDEWSIGYGQAYTVDGLQLYANWGGASFSPRAAARIGQLMMHGGEWEGKKMFDKLLVQTMTSFAGMPSGEPIAEEPSPVSGLCWWLNSEGAWPNVPRDAFVGAGSGQKLLLVVPSLDLIVVRDGTWLGKQDRFWRDSVEQVFNPAVEIAKSRPPYARSPVIRGVEFAPATDIARKAIDSDNWPITWGDDDAQYTSYGDGEGFEPFVERKLSMGLAKVTGTPGQFEGINIRSSTGERVGSGANGAKASGMLMVKGTLYMLVRNTGNAQLAWSEDHGRTWTWGFHFTKSFGSPTFLNFGQNYSGARDEFVYVYSQDGNSAYESSDGIILARVPLTHVRDLSAYEYFVKLGAKGESQWTRNIESHGPVFRFPGHCQRTDVVYNPLLKRYLLALGYNHNGGWGIYDAPEPWGPWTTVYHTDYWGLGGTHGYRLPAKWMGPDAHSMTLVFSGVKLPDITYDAFAVRQMTLELTH